MQLRRLAAAIAVLLALAASPARAFDLDPGPGMHSQASFRGDEIGVRDYAYDTDDFLTIFSYFHPLEGRLLFERAPVALRGTAGSVANDAFYLDIAGRLGFTFWDRVTVRYRFVQDEDFDSRYMRNLFEGEIVLGAGFFVAAGTELTQEKVRIDISGGLGWRGAGGLEARVDYVATDVFSNKAEDFEYEERPQTLMAQLAVPVVAGVTLTAWAHATPSFDLDAQSGAFDEDDPFRFAFEKYIFGGRADADLGAAGRTGVRVRYERARKATLLTGLPDPNAPPDDPFTTVAVRRQALIAEALHALPVRGERDELEVGLYSIWLREGNDFADDGRDERIKTFQLFAKVRYAWRPLEGAPWLRFSPAVYAGWADIETEKTVESRRVREVQAKLSLAFDLVPSEKIRIVFNPTFRLDEPEFGGGNVQIVMTF